MKKITFFIPLVAIFLMAFSCSKSDDDTTVAIRDFDEQYTTDEAALQTFFNDYHMEVDPVNFNVTIAKKLTGEQSIRAEYGSQLIDTTVIYNSKEYKIHFIKFREGTQKRPTQIDSVYVSYKGMGLDGTQFDGADNPVWFKMTDLISGWAHILPNFKTGTYSSTSPADPPIHSNYGAGVMFLPSGFGYFSNSIGDLGSYAPLIFSFKLYELKYRDQDGDGILSKDERDLTTEPNINYKWKINPLKYDSDGDGISNLYDIDDDNDNYTTKYELKEFSPIDHSITAYYTFDNIPTCSSGKKRHLDPSCHGN